GTNRYKVVILPNVESIPLGMLQKLDEFSRTGGVLIATRRVPAVAPGFQATPADDDRIRDLSRRLFEGTSAPGHLVTNETTQLSSTLTRLTQPDVLFSSARSE